MSHDTETLKRDLAHVLWIGGATDAGKTSIATAIAARHGLRRYQFDRHEPAHFARADPAFHPALHAAHPDRMTPEQRWLGSPPEAMARATIASWSERCDMAFDDLRALPTTPPIVAEGPGFFPARIVPLLAHPRQAVWLVPTEPFKRAVAIARGKPGNRHQTSDPARAQANIIARDLLMAAVIAREARAMGLTLIEVDGKVPLDAMIARVEGHFAPLLAAWRDVQSAGNLTHP